VLFDQNGQDTFKFAAISEVTDQVIIGHHTGRSGWVTDAAVAWTIDADTGYELAVSLQGTTVSVSVDDQAVLGYVFNALVVDGDFGLFSRDGSSSYDTVTIRTDDPAYLPEDTGESLMVTTAASEPVGAAGALSVEALAPIH
jgi:hypothetical protein